MKIKHTGVFLFLLYSYTISFDQNGIIIRKNTTADQLLTKLGSGNYQELQKLITLYSPFADYTSQEMIAFIKKQNKDFFSPLLRDAGYLLEGFYAHAGMLMGMRVCAGIDTTDTIKLNPALFFSQGVVQPISMTPGQTTSQAPTPTDIPLPSLASGQSVSEVVSLPSLCASLFHASRYLRIINEKNTPMLPDLCVGAVFLNKGRIYSLVPSSNLNFKPQKENNYFWLPAGISVQTLEGQLLGFVNNYTLKYVPFAQGMDQWSMYNQARAFKLVVANDVGSNSFSSAQLGNGSMAITLQIALDGSLSIYDAQGTIMHSVNLSVLQKFYNTIGGPWAVIIEMYNQKPELGNLFPLFVIKGVMKMNYLDFPLQIQATQSKKIGTPFSVSSLLESPQLLFQELRSVGRYTKSNLEHALLYGSCTSYAFNVSLPLYKKNELYVEPINPAFAKIYSAWTYDWETSKYTIGKAIQGIKNIMSQSFFKEENMNLSYFEHDLRKALDTVLLL